MAHGVSAVSTLTALKERTTGTSGTFRLGDTTAVFDATYGPLKATWVYNQAPLTTYNQCAAAFEDPAAGDWYVDEDEDESGVIGQEFVVGAFLNTAAETAAGYCWVLTAGRNPFALKTDGSVAAGYGVRSSATNGTWSGVATSFNLATTGTAYAGWGQFAGIATTEDTSNVLAAGDCIFASIWSVFPVTC